MTIRAASPSSLDFVPTQRALAQLHSSAQQLADASAPLRQAVAPSCWSSFARCARSFLCMGNPDDQRISVDDELARAVVNLDCDAQGVAYALARVANTYQETIDSLNRGKDPGQLAADNNHSLLERHIRIAEVTVQHVLTSAEAPACYPPRGHIDFPEQPPVLAGYIAKPGQLNPRVAHHLGNIKRAAIGLRNTIGDVCQTHDVKSLQQNPNYNREQRRQRELEEASTLGNYYDAHRA